MVRLFVCVYFLCDGTRDKLNILFDVPSSICFIVLNYRFITYKSIDMIDFSNHLLTNYERMRLANCTHLINMPSVCVNCKTKIYRIVASSYLNHKAPINSKEITVKKTGGNWYNSEIRKARKVMRKAEKLYHKHGN